jgi:hypothetical protein
MILTREITIKVNTSNFQYFDDLGYDVVIGEEIKIPVELLSKGSHHKIKCECDSCGIIKDVIFKNYVKYDNKWGYYYCRKCSEKKRKESLKDSYGVEYPIQNKEIFKKMKQTLFDRKK